MNMHFYMMIMMFLSTIMMFSFYYQHILLTLICMEFIMINILMMLFFLMNILKINMFFLTLFLCVSICEGIIGLSTMVYMIRMTGNDYLNMMNLLKW